MENPIFSGIDDDSAAIFLNSPAFSEAVCLPSDSINFDDLKNNFIVILSGSVLLCAADADGIRTIFQTFNAGSVFSDAFAYSSGGQSFYLEVPEKSEILYIKKSGLLSLPSDNDYAKGKLISNILNAVDKSMAAMARHMSFVICRSTRKKLMEYFISLCSYMGSRNVRIPMTMAELADYLCVDRSSMLREIRKMCRDGIIVSKKPPNNAAQITAVGKTRRISLCRVFFAAPAL